MAWLSKESSCPLPFWQKAKRFHLAERTHFFLAQSPRKMQSLRLHIAVDDATKNDISDNQKVSTQWFGDGRSIALKDNVEAAVHAFQEYWETDPEWILSVEIAADEFVKWTHANVLKRTAHVHGYRLSQDLDLTMPGLASSWHQLNV